MIKVDIGITLGYYSFIKAGRFMQPSPPLLQPLDVSHNFITSGLQL